MEHPDVLLVRFLTLFINWELLATFSLSPLNLLAGGFQRLFFSLLSAVFFLCSTLLHLNLAGSLAVGGGGGG